MLEVMFISSVSLSWFIGIKKNFPINIIFLLITSFSISSTEAEFLETEISEVYMIRKQENNQDLLHMYTLGAIMILKWTLKNSSAKIYKRKLLHVWFAMKYEEP